MFGLGTQEMLLLLILGVLLFGKNLPEVGRSIGKGIREFKTSLGGLEETFLDDRPYNRPAPPVATPKPPQRIGTTAPKFEDKPPV